MFNGEHELTVAEKKTHKQQKTEEHLYETHTNIVHRLLLLQRERRIDA